MSDGTVLRIKPIITDVARFEGKHDKDNNPVYSIKHQIVATIVSTPNSLKKKAKIMPISNTCCALATITITTACSSFSSFANDDKYITDHTFQNSSSAHIISFTSAAPSLQWHHELERQIENLSRRQNGWKGPKSKAPNEDAKQYAKKLLQQLVIAQITKHPMIGLDFEGTFSFSWFDNQVSADLTVYDNGTYSFFISNKRGEMASADEDRIGDQLNLDFLKILNS